MGRAAFVGCTNAGTQLANAEHWGESTDWYTNAAVCACRLLQSITLRIQEFIDEQTLSGSHNVLDACGDAERYGGVPMARGALRPFVSGSALRRRAERGPKRSLSGASENTPGRFHSGPLSKRVWCGRRELNPHGLAACGFSCHFGFRRPAERVRGLDYTFTIPLTRARCCPSSLYTFPEVLPGLARDCHYRFPRL